MKNTSLSAIILSAGLSSRFQYPKALLPFDEKQNFLQKIIEEYSLFGVDEIAVVLNAALKEKVEEFISCEPKVKIVINDLHTASRFYSVQLGLQNIHSSYCFLHNIDNPFVNKKLLTSLAANKNEHGYTVPVYQGKGGHPVLISQKIIKHICNNKNNEANLREVLNLFDRKELQVSQSTVLANINTVEDYKLYLGNYSDKKAKGIGYLSEQTLNNFKRG